MGNIPYDVHVFICTNKKEKGESCGPKNSEQLVSAIKEKLKGIETPVNFRINKSGCLGVCEKGIACVVYPKGQWLTELTSNDSQKIIDALNQRD